MYPATLFGNRGLSPNLLIGLRTYGWAWLLKLDEALREGSKDMGESMLKGMEEMNRVLRESIEEMQKQREQKQQSEAEGEGLI